MCVCIVCHKSLVTVLIVFMFIQIGARGRLLGYVLALVAALLKCNSLRLLDVNW